MYYLKRTRSVTKTFDFRSNCFLCGTFISAREKRNGTTIVFVSCKERKVDIPISNAIKERKNDDWGTEVKGRLELLNDLRAEDAVYHTICNSNFRTGKVKPKAFSNSNTPQKRGRRSDETQEAAFIEVTKYLKENDDEQITLTDLTNMMGKLCPEPIMAYSNVWMKKKLQEYFGDDIIITNINGKSDVVTFVTTAKKILAEFYETTDFTLEDVEEQKQRIIKTAAKIIKSDVKSRPSVNTYPSME